ncbi:MAG TPA: gephyrin-like molybdotransferase Glp [Syntrophorhabdaceae bacterium]|nr:gephyrin-like molybdotransferase Glp [Syntrophorhabdaceae bacterium]
MLTYEDAVNTILSTVTTLDAVSKRLLRCLGRVASESVYTDFDLPQVPASGPDGYAVRSLDVAAASQENPAILRISGTARAGCVLKRRLEQGAAIRIMTGAVVPAGADCVIRFEDTDEPRDKNGPNSNNPSHVKIFVSAKPGHNIRPAGSNVRKGTLIVPEGTVIGPTQIYALAAVGKREIRIVRRPTVAIIATGDELINPGNRLAIGKTYNCNASTLASLVSYYGGIPRILGIARDNEASLTSKIKMGMKSDVIITSGGVSMGDYDLVRLVLGKLGKIVFSRIKMGPGAAVVFGTISRSAEDNGVPPIPVFSLAGPPAGCFINFETLVRPALLKMRGITTVTHPQVEAIALDSVPEKKKMTFVKYTRLQEKDGQHCVTLNADNDTGMLASIAAANSLTIIPQGVAVNAGDNIGVLPLDWR